MHCDICTYTWIFSLVGNSLNDIQMYKNIDLCTKNGKNDFPDSSRTIERKLNIFWISNLGFDGFRIEILFFTKASKNVRCTWQLLDFTFRCQLQGPVIVLFKLISHDRHELCLKPVHVHELQLTERQRKTENFMNCSSEIAKGLLRIRNRIQFQLSIFVYLLLIIPKSKLSERLLFI